MRPEATGPNPRAAGYTAVRSLLDVKATLQAEFKKADLSGPPQLAVRRAGRFFCHHMSVFSEGAIRAVAHPAGVVLEAVAVPGVFAVDLLTGQVLARMDTRERNKLARVGSAAFGGSCRSEKSLPSASESGRLCARLALSTRWS
jgi:hypothetical protein